MICPMLCRHCHNQIEEGFQFCPKCGLRLKTVSQFLKGSEGRRAIRWGVALAVMLFGGGLILFAVRQNQISKLRQRERDGLAYVAWLASEIPSASILELAIGKPLRSSQVSSGRSITWFRIRDGFLGMENSSGIFHFRPDKLWSSVVPSGYQQQSEPVLVAGELVTTYSGSNDLSLTALASDKRPSTVTEFIVWKLTSN